jgi:serine protease Do
MKPTVAMAFGAAVALAAGMAAPGARAGERGSDEKRIEKRVVVRHGGGGFLGVGLDDVEGDARGAKVRSVRPESPAAKAGIKDGDVVVRFDGEGVRSAAHLVRLVAETPAGRSIAVEVLRTGKAEKLSVTLGEGDRLVLPGGEPARREYRFELPMPPVPPDVSVEDGFVRVTPHQPPRLGLEFIEIGEQLAASYQLERDNGVLVASVQAGSAAAKAGVKAGDIVLELDGHEIKDGGDLRSVVEDADAGETVKIKLLRAGHPLELDVTFGGLEQHSHGPTL